MRVGLPLAMFCGEKVKLLLFAQALADGLPGLYTRMLTWCEAGEQQARAAVEATVAGGRGGRGIGAPLMSDLLATLLAG
jgi:hypothetical protein